MTNIQRPLLALCAAFTFTGCDGFREALTAHVDIAARAGDQELTVERLASLLASTDAPITAEFGRTVADVWVNYHLLAHAAARGDSLTAIEDIDEAMWPVIAQAKASRWHQQVVENMPGLDTTVSETRYARGDLLAAQHVLLFVPEDQPEARDSLRVRAAQIRAQITPANFREMARQHSDDNASAQRGGELGVFPRGVMVPPFEQAVAALPPGEISPVVETQFGFHIIRRLPLDEVREQFATSVRLLELQRAESTWLAALEQGYRVQYKPNAVAVIRRAVEDPEANTRSRAVIATSRSGDLTAGRLAQWVAALPQRDQIRMGVASADDSTVMEFGRRVMTQEMVLHQADSARIMLDSTELREVRSGYEAGLAQSWATLGVQPQVLADSAGTPAERHRFAAQRVDEYVDALLAGQARFLDVPGPIQSAVRNKYSWRVTTAGVTRAVELAEKRRTEADSLARANRPATQVPITPQTPPGQPQDD